MSQPSDEKAAAHELLETLEKYSAAFDELCQKRHEAGQVEYGAFTFLGNDVVRMMAEELADTSNYCRMQFMKLMMLNEMLLEEMADKGITEADGSVTTIGAQSFHGTKGGWS